MKRQKYRYEMLENQMEPMAMQPIRQPKPEHTLEAQVRDGDTLQAIALRFHCRVSEIKRLNKIDKDNEIFARKVLKVPITPHSVLLEEMPAVHKSGQNSPKQDDAQQDNSKDSVNGLVRNQLGEKLLVVSVNSSDIKKTNEINGSSSVNDVILNSEFKRNHLAGDDQRGDGENDSDNVPHPRVLPMPPKSLMDCSGSDCDISWIFLLILILALCVLIPLVYVLYIAEHPEKYNHPHTEKYNHHKN